MLVTVTVHTNDREECFDCKRDDALEPALFWCVDASCGCDGQRPLCSEHADIHRLKRSHVVVRRTHELGIPADRLPGVTTCDKEGHGGPLVIACKSEGTCGALLCLAPGCAPLHPHHAEPISDAGARAVPVLKSALATLEAHRTTASDTASQARSDLRRLHQRRADALAALRTLYDAQVAEVNRVFQEKEALLLALLTKARAAAGEAATAAAACDLALRVASSDPLILARVARSVLTSASILEAREASFAPVDSSLEVVVNYREPVFASTVGLVKTWENSAHCSLEWEGKRDVHPGRELSLVLKLCNHRMSPCDEVPVDAVNVQLLKSPPVASLESEADTELPTTRTALALTAASPGVYKAVFNAPEAIDGSILTADAFIQGRPVASTSAGRVYTREPLAWDPFAGSLRTISPDGWLTATNRATYNSCFRGRTGLCRPGSSELKLQLEVVTGPEVQNLTIAIGSTDKFQGSTWNFSKNPSFPFFYEAFYGAVNATPYHSNTGQLRVNSRGKTYKFIFCVKDHMMTFQAGLVDGAPASGQGRHGLQSQPGEWDLPDAFYLLIGCDHAGYVAYI